MSRILTMFNRGNIVNSYTRLLGFLSKFQQNLMLKKGDLKKLGLFTTVFGIVKVCAFTSVLWMSNLVLDLSYFGFFEYTLAVGLILAIPLNAGLHGAYPYFIIKLGRKGFKPLFYFHSVAIASVLGLIISLDLVLFDFLPSKLLFALLIGSIVSMQVMLSTILKSHEIILKATFLDGGIFLVINAYNIYIQSTGGFFDFNMFKELLVMYWSFLYGTFIWQFFQLKEGFSFKKYKIALHYGKSLLISSFLVMCLTGSARIFIEWFLNFEAVGIYGFYFRFAVVTVLIHQVINIVFFKKMYKLEPKVLDKFFSALLAGLVVIGMISWLVIPAVLKNWFTIFETTFVEYKPLYFILTFQMVFWICLALNENIIYRERLSSQMNIGLIVIILFMAGSVWALSLLGRPDVFSIAMINMAAIFLACEYQFYLMKKKRDVCFKQSNRICRGVLVLFGLTYFLIF